MEATFTFGCFFCDRWVNMKQSLDDKEIRESLFDTFEESGEKLRFFEELTIGKSRADAILVMEGCLKGFEIKSDVDSLKRLSGQMKDYTTYCDENYLVVGTYFLKKAIQHLPDTWGIYSCQQTDKKRELVCVRDAQKNTKVNRKAQLSLLWRAELIHIVKKYKLGGVTKRNRKQLAELILSKLDDVVILHELCEELMEREYQSYE